MTYFYYKLFFIDAQLLSQSIQDVQIEQQNTLNQINENFTQASLQRELELNQTIDKINQDYQLEVQKNIQLYEQNIIDINSNFSVWDTTFTQLDTNLNSIVNASLKNIDDVTVSFFIFYLNYLFSLISLVLFIHQCNLKYGKDSF
jgi:hypothetical protein